MSKTPAPKAPPKKTAAGKGTVAVSNAAKPAKAGAVAKPAAKPAVQPATRPIAKKAASAPIRPAPAPARFKPVAAPAAVAKSATGVAKTAFKTVSKAAPTPPVMKSAPAPVVVPAASVVAVTPMVPKKSGRGASKYPAPAVQAPLPAPTSRFADRFAPPRPPTRQMNNLELDTPRHAQKSDPKLANAWKSKAGRDLTEPEVLAMPESEYMNDKQLEFFRFNLQTLKDDLLSNAGETTEHLREDTSIVPDPADRATIEEEHALELRTRDRERKLLKKISQSLQRIDTGEYGFCDETGEPIGLGRLIARPTATLSLEAQQRRELKQKMFGD